MSEVLRVTDLRKEFRVSGGQTLVAVQGVSFHIESGDSLAIVGQSGSGKTTCAEIIAGLQRATSGTVELCGTPLLRSPRTHSDRRARATQVQMVFQDPYASLDPRQTVASAIGEVLTEYSSESRNAIRDATAVLLEKVGLDERIGKSKPRQLSGGQRQRVAIARALAARPKLLILDEAVAALDVSVQAQIIQLLADLRRDDGLTYLFVSHDLGVVRQVSDHCLVMHRGQVVEAGETDSVLDHPQHEYTRSLIAAIPRPGWKPRLRGPIAP